MLVFVLVLISEFCSGVCVGFLVICCWFLCSFLFLSLFLSVIMVLVRLCWWPWPDLQLTWTRQRWEIFYDNYQLFIIFIYDTVICGLGRQYTCDYWSFPRILNFSLNGLACSTNANHLWDFRSGKQFWQVILYNLLTRTG